MKLKIYSNNQYVKEMEYDRPIMIFELEEALKDEFQYPIYACRINGHRARLDDIVREDCEVDLLDLKDPWANMVYQASLSLLYCKAVHDVLGKDVEVKFCNSLSKGIYTTLKTSGIESDTDSKIEARMKELVKENHPIHQTIFSKSKLEEYYKNEGEGKKLSMLEATPDLKMAFLSELEDEKQIFYLYMVPSTSYLNFFEVKRYKNGMLLRFPHPTNPLVVPPFEEQTILYNAFSEATRWDKITGIEYASDFNRAIQEKDITQLVLLSEALHEKKIAELAEEIKASGKRLILIAGPSSSGKTTFAKRLCTQLRVSGLKPLYLGTDDYFIERDQTPLGEDGEPDFECLQAIDIPLLTKQMNDLLEGKKVDIPRFDFVDGTKHFHERIVSIGKSQPIVMEGLHCLNPELTKGIARENKFTIYISPLTQLNIDANNRIPTTDARMLRRIVRDAKFRNIPASETIANWHKVRQGEDQYIFPFSDEADRFFNSHTLYELSLLKTYAKPQLETITKDMKEYPEASRMLHFLQFFVEMKDEELIPNNSIMREFIGGSILKDQH